VKKAGQRPGLSRSRSTVSSSTLLPSSSVAVDSKTPKSRGSPSNLSHIRRRGESLTVKKQKKERMKAGGGEGAKKERK